MFIKLFFRFLLLSLLPWRVAAQTPFSLRLVPENIPGAPGLQSFSVGEWNGEWLLLGGRQDGLHKRQPFAAFDEASQNDRVYVINPATKQVWSAPVSSLPDAVAEQFHSTNLQFTQRDSVLYITGGYGFSPSAGDHVTHPLLTAIDLPGMAEAIRQGTSLAPFVRTLSDQRMAVTGGQMALLEGKFYLVGGHRFDGRYNPMNHPTFIQEYTNQIRIFRIVDDGANLSIQDYHAWTDAQHLHRRDYNLAPTIFPDGRPGLTLFSGVFQYNNDLPWLYPVDIDTSGYMPRPEFAQYLNHYHCAHAALFDESHGVHHTLFFGGMAEYTLDTNGTLVQDINVPFVRTIARVTRYADGSLEEIKLPVDMPALLGSGAEFRVHPDVPVYPNGVIRLNDLTGDSALLGYIFGGIESPQPNIFFTNIPSAATPMMYQVWLSKKLAKTGEQVVRNPLRMRISPNPATGDLQIYYWLPENAPVRVRIYLQSGRLLGEFDEGDRTEGVLWMKLAATGLPKGVLLVNLLAGKVQVTQRVALY